MDALKIERAIVGGCDWEARTANILAALWSRVLTGSTATSIDVNCSERRENCALPLIIRANRHEHTGATSTGVRRTSGRHISESTQMSLRSKERSEMWRS
jgi:hypothetical protein